MRKVYAVMLFILLGLLTSCSSIKEIPDTIFNDHYQFYSVSEVNGQTIGSVDKVKVMNDNKVIVEWSQVLEDLTQTYGIAIIEQDKVIGTIPNAKIVADFCADSNNTIYVLEHGHDDSGFYVKVKSYDETGHELNSFTYQDDFWYVNNQIFVINGEVHVFYLNDSNVLQHLTLEKDSLDFINHESINLKQSNNSVLPLGVIYKDNSFKFVIREVDDGIYIKIISRDAQSNLKTLKSIKVHGSKVRMTNDAVMVASFDDDNEKENRIFIIDTESMKITYDKQNEKFNTFTDFEIISNQYAYIKYPLTEDTTDLYQIDYKTGHSKMVSFNGHEHILSLLDIKIASNGTVVIIKDNDGSARDDTILIGEKDK